MRSFLLIICHVLCVFVCRSDDIIHDDEDYDSTHHRLLQHHQHRYQLNKETLNQKITLLSEKQKQNNIQRLEDLQEVVKALQNNFHFSDTDCIHSLLHKIVNDTLHQSASDINVTNSLQNLELLRDYLHQMDNAVDFGKMGGLAIMLELVLDFPYIEVRSSAAWTIGLACQNNPDLMQIAHNVSIVQNILYLLKLSSNKNDNFQYPKINLFDANHISYLAKLIWTLSALTRQNSKSYDLFKKYDATNSILYDWLMEVYEFWNLNKENEQLLNDNFKNKVIEKILMFASDVVILNPEQRLFIDDKWCDVFAAHFNYAQNNYAIREMTLAYWDVAIHQFFCVQCIPYASQWEHIQNERLSVDIGLRKIWKLKTNDEFDMEMKKKAKKLLKFIKKNQKPTEQK